MARRRTDVCEYEPPSGESIILIDIDNNVNVFIFEDVTEMEEYGLETGDYYIVEKVKKVTVEDKPTVTISDDI